MKNVAVGLLGAAAVATTILLVRQQRVVEPTDVRLVPTGESRATLSLERIREAGL